MSRPLLYLLGTACLLSAAPQPPSIRFLDPVKIEEIAIHSEMDTLLMFPSPVTLIAGKGLTTGEEPGEVLFQHAEDPRLILLRQIKEGSNLLMHVVLGEENFVYRLKGGDRPASTIRFQRRGEGAPAVAIPEEEARVRNLDVSRERALQLMRLAQSATLLKEKIPDAYQGYRSSPTSAETSVGGLVVEVKEVARFDAEDAIVILGSIRNGTEKKIRLQDVDWRIGVGETRTYRPNHSQVASGDLGPGGRTDFTTILVGDGRSPATPQNLSPNNQFRVALQPSNSK